MPVFTLKVTQIVRLTRTFRVEVEAETIEAAIENQYESEGPDDGWNIVSEELMDEFIREVVEG